MKKLFLSLFLIGSLMLTSCSGNSPKAVAEKFMTAVNANNFEEAGKYCDAQTSQLLKSLNELMKSVPSSDAKNEQLFKGFKITKVEENGDKAKVFYTTEDSNGKETALDLKKVDGKWIVSMNKENKENGAPHDHNHDGHDHDMPEMDPNIDVDAPDMPAEVEDAQTTTPTNK
ncbi:DUF4878 domain-containing protein [Capnocytophaga sputigena]